DVDVLLEKVPVLPEHAFVEEGLLVGPSVHEVVVLPLLVEVLHLLFLDVRTAHLIAALEGRLKHAPSQQAPDAGSHESRSFARLDVLNLDDLERLPVHLDLESLAEFGSVDDARHALTLLCS